MLATCQMTYLLPYPIIPTYLVTWLLRALTASSCFCLASGALSDKLILCGVLCYWLAQISVTISACSFINDSSDSLIPGRGSAFSATCWILDRLSLSITCDGNLFRRRGMSCDRILGPGIIIFYPMSSLSLSQDHPGFDWFSTQYHHPYSPMQVRAGHMLKFKSEFDLK